MAFQQDSFQDDAFQIILLDFFKEYLYFKTTLYLSLGLVSGLIFINSFKTLLITNLPIITNLYLIKQLHNLLTKFIYYKTDI
jgi:hypothetical protein